MTFIFPKLSYSKFSKLDWINEIIFINQYEEWTINPILENIIYFLLFELFGQIDKGLKQGHVTDQNRPIITMELDI